MSKCPHCGQAVTYQRCSKCGVECHGSFGEGMCEKCATAPKPKTLVEMVEENNRRPVR
jgi:RecJ-like exonuclease